MKLLYLSCHAILEYDEVKLFEDMGLDYFSLGSYIDPQKPVDPIRPPLKKVVDPELLRNAPLREAIPKSFADKFDVIVIMSMPKWVSLNWENIKHKRVVYRTIGQHTSKEEEFLKPYKAQGLQIVRYALKEKNIPSYAGEDAVIRFYKDPGEFNNWNGQNKRIITFAQNMKTRGEFCNYDTFVKFAQGFDAKVYGPKNEDSGDLSGGFQTYEEMRQTMRDNRVYFYTGTQPASYVLNFIEAFMTGIPIVAIGPAHATSLKLNGDVYEIPDIIRNGVNGYWSDDISELRIYAERLLNDHEHAKDISASARKTAISLFGKEVIWEKWRQFLRV